jgi:hypothetical protein
MGVTIDSLTDCRTLWGEAREYIDGVDPEYSPFRFDFKW